jgi:DNA polymerase-3 subunit gamma/tau
VEGGRQAGNAAQRDGDREVTAEGRGRRAANGTEGRSGPGDGGAARRDGAPAGGTAPDAAGEERGGAAPVQQVPTGRVTTPLAPVSEIDAGAVRRIWPEVLDAVKRRRRTTHALLMNVSVQAVNHGVLVLAIESEVLSRLLTQDINTDVIRGAVRDVLGVDWRVQVVIDGAPVGGAAGRPEPAPEEDPRDDEPSPPEPGAAPPRRTDPEEAAISLLESALGARRVEEA